MVARVPVAESECMDGPLRKTPLGGESLSEGISGRRRIITEYENNVRPGSCEDQVQEMIEEMYE